MTAEAAPNLDENGLRRICDRDDVLLLGGAERLRIGALPRAVPRVSGSQENSRMKNPRIRVSLAALAAVLALATTSSATDVGVAGTSASIKVNLKKGTKKVKSVQKGPNVHLGAAATPAQISGELSIHYVDSPGNIGTLAMPSPWSASNALFAKYKGSSPVKAAIVKNGSV